MRDDDAVIPAAAAADAGAAVLPTVVTGAVYLSVAGRQVPGWWQRRRGQVVVVADERRVMTWPTGLLPALHEVSTSPTHTHTRLTALFPGLPRWAGTRNLDFTEARDSEWQWHQLGRMQVCTSLQTDSHASTPPLSFLQAGCPSCRPTNSVKALKATSPTFNCRILYGRYAGNIYTYYSHYSITLSLFHPMLKTFLFCKSFPSQSSFSSLGLTPRIPRTVH